METDEEIPLELPQIRWDLRRIPEQQFYVALKAFCRACSWEMLNTFSLVCKRLLAIVREEKEMRMTIFISKYKLPMPNYEETTSFLFIRNLFHSKSVVLSFGPTEILEESLREMYADDDFTSENVVVDGKLLLGYDDGPCLRYFGPAFYFLFSLSLRNLPEFLSFMPSVTADLLVEAKRCGILFSVETRNHLLLHWDPYFILHYSDSLGFTNSHDPSPLASYFRALCETPGAIDLATVLKMGWTFGSFDDAYYGFFKFLHVVDSFTDLTCVLLEHLIAEFVKERCVPGLHLANTRMTNVQFFEATRSETSSTRCVQLILDTMKLLKFDFAGWPLFCSVFTTTRKTADAVVAKLMQFGWNPGDTQCCILPAEAYKPALYEGVVDAVKSKFPDTCFYTLVSEEMTRRLGDTSVHFVQFLQNWLFEKGLCAKHKKLICSGILENLYTMPTHRNLRAEAALAAILKTFKPQDLHEDDELNRMIVLELIQQFPKLLKSLVESKAMTPEDWEHSRIMNVLEECRRVAKAVNLSRAGKYQEVINCCKEHGFASKEPTHEELTRLGMYRILADDITRKRLDEMNAELEHRWKKIATSKATKKLRVFDEECKKQTRERVRGSKRKR